MVNEEKGPSPVLWAKGPERRGSEIRKLELPKRHPLFDLIAKRKEERLRDHRFEESNRRHIELFKVALDELLSTPETARMVEILQRLLDTTIGCTNNLGGHANEHHQKVLSGRPFPTALDRGYMYTQNRRDDTQVKARLPVNLNKDYDNTEDVLHAGQMYAVLKMINQLLVLGDVNFDRERGSTSHVELRDTSDIIFSGAAVYESTEEQGDRMFLFVDTESGPGGAESAGNTRPSEHASIAHFQERRGNATKTHTYTLPDETKTKIYNIIGALSIAEGGNCQEWKEAVEKTFEQHDKEQKFSVSESGVVVVGSETVDEERFQSLIEQFQNILVKKE